MVEQLWMESSAKFSLPGLPLNSGSVRWAAPRIRAVFWSSGRICWQVNLYLISLRRSGLAVSTINTYASELSVFIAYLCNAKLLITQVDDDVLLEYSEYLLERGKSGSHINRLILRGINYLAWYQHIFPGDLLVGEIGSGSNITIRVRAARGYRGKASSRIQHMSMVPASVPRLVRPISLIDLTKIVAACDTQGATSYKKARDRCLVTLMADSGIRREELTWITCNQIRDALKNGRKLIIRTSKRHGNPEREVPIPQETLAMLTDFIEVNRAILIRRIKKNKSLFNDEGWAFCTRLGGKIAPVTISQLFNSLRKYAGIESRVTPHMLRHRYITLQVLRRLQAIKRANVGLEILTTILSQVASLSGHGNLDSLWTYVDWAYEELDASVTQDPNDKLDIDVVLSQLLEEARGKGSEAVIRVLESLQSSVQSCSINKPRLNVVTHSIR